MENHMTVNSRESFRRGRLWSHWRGWSNLKDINWDGMMCRSMWWKFKPVHVPAVSAVSLPGMTAVYREKQVGYFPKGLWLPFLQVYTYSKGLSLPLSDYSSSRLVLGLLAGDPLALQALFLVFQLRYIVEGKRLRLRWFLRIFSPVYPFAQSVRQLQKSSVYLM